MVILDEKFLKEVDSAKERIDESKLDGFVRHMFDTLSKEAIEQTSVQDHDNAQRKDEVIENFQNAWVHGLNEYSGEFDLIFLTNIAGRIEPYLREQGQNHAEIRKGSVAMKRSEYIPPADRSRVFEHLNRLMNALKDNDFHPVEEAIFLYHHLIRIQPFENGNKRTANTVMNLTLMGNGYAPITINSRTEGPTLKTYILQAIRSFQETGGHAKDPVMDPYILIEGGQKQLYNFLAQKELKNLRSIEDELKGCPRYVVQLKSKDRGPLFTAKRMIGAWFQRDIPHQERLYTNQAELEVVGQIPKCELEKVLNKVHGVQKFTIEYQGNK